VVKFSVRSIRKRTREDLGKEREVLHTDVRRRKRNMHGEFHHFHLKAFRSSGLGAPGLSAWLLFTGFRFV
jgi:hypothetical protein